MSIFAKKEQKKWAQEGRAIAHNPPWTLTETPQMSAIRSAPAGSG